MLDLLVSIPLMCCFCVYVLYVWSVSVAQELLLYVT